MKFDFRYYGNTAVDSGPYRSNMSFSPDTSRAETYFNGEVGESLAFREAMSALHEVVVGDLRFRPKDRTAYREWAAKREEEDRLTLAAQQGRIAGRIEKLQKELQTLRRQHHARWTPFFRARDHYFRWLLVRDFDAWVVLDPVITIHPDEVFFECFSIDESSYGRVGVSHEAFRKVGEFACGTTNVDYSAGLYDEFQKIRRYKSTNLLVDPSGFTVQVEDDDAFKEVKIDLPDSWVRGFLQVSSAMTLPTVSFELHPMDVHNLCFVLRRRREKRGPRSLRYLLEPGKPVRILVEPWDIVIDCPRSRYEGLDAHEIRVWGRRRIHVLERLIPVAERFVVHLLGKGMPSFYVAELGHLTFTLGLSGWTANDWSTAGNFDLMAPRAEVDAFTMRRVFEALGKRWLASAAELAKELGLDTRIVLGSLGVYTQHGRAMYDMHRGVYRLRELTRDPLPMDQLRFANDREQSAWRLIAAGDFRIRREARPGGGRSLRSKVRDRHRSYEVELGIDMDERLVTARCECNFYSQNALRQGPCEHMLAVRLREGLTN